MTVDDDMDYCPHCGAVIGTMEGCCDECGWDAEEEDEDDIYGVDIGD